MLGQTTEIVEKLQKPIHAASELEFKLRETEESFFGLEVLLERLRALNGENTRTLEEMKNMDAVLSRLADDQKKTLTEGLTRLKA
ncbi:hypothetical protein BC829DRAFT_487898 [Chytridium lagenaria]|nr:hypothetical protein BC829DRAFT_487898 [Chytridium lagenaria]